LDLLLRLYQERRMTVILITHDPTVASRAPRVLRMKDGRVESESA